MWVIVAKLMPLTNKKTNLRKKNKFPHTNQEKIREILLR